MRTSALFLSVLAFVLLPASIAADRFDGNWQTKLTCPARGNTEGYTWQFVSVIKDGALHAERGAAGEPGYLQIEGKVAQDGSAKLNAKGIVASRQYARGIFTGKGDGYSYGIKAQFKDTQGSGTRNEGLGVVGRPCTFEFSKQTAGEGGSR